MKPNSDDDVFEGWKNSAHHQMEIVISHIRQTMANLKRGALYEAQVDGHTSIEALSHAVGMIAGAIARKPKGKKK